MAYLRALARQPNEKELETLQAFLDRERRRFRTQTNEPEEFLNIGLFFSGMDIPPTELAAWTSLCRSILNLHETITRY